MKEDAQVTLGESSLVQLKTEDVSPHLCGQPLWRVWVRAGNLCDPDGLSLCMMTSNLPLCSTTHSKKTFMHSCAATIRKIL